LADTHNAIERTHRIVHDAEAVVEQASADLETAKSQVAGCIAQATKAGNQPAHDDRLREACVRHLEAEHQLAAAKSALAQLEASIDEHQYALQQADEQVNKAALAVIAAEIDPPTRIEQLLAAHERWCVLHAQLYWLLNRDLTGDFDPECAYPRHADRLMRGGPSAEALRATWQLDKARLSQQSTLWDQCLQALTSDPDTPLPAA
jgi:hypothetical protein